MVKDYKKWHRVKSHLENSTQIKQYSSREIWWCSLGSNIGVEQDGKNFMFERPVLIFKKFNNQMLWALPMTSKVREGIYFFSLKVGGVEKGIILSQLKLISAKRLRRKISKISNLEYLSLQQKLINLIKKAP